MTQANRKQRRASAAIQRKQMATQQIKIQAVDPEAKGEAVIFEKTLKHPHYGNIPIALTGGYEDDIKTYSEMLSAQRGIPIDFSEQSLAMTDQYVQYYIQKQSEVGSGDVNYARRMAARAWSIEAEQAQGHAYILSLFKYVKFVGNPPRECLSWESPEEMERYGRPPRPERVIHYEPERSLAFIFNLIETGEFDDDTPSFNAQILAAGREAAQAWQQIVDDAIGWNDEEEPVDDDGFRGDDAYEVVDAPDDAGGETEG